MSLAKCRVQFQLGVGGGAEVLKERMKGGSEGWRKEGRARTRAMEGGNWAWAEGEELGGHEGWWRGWCRCGGSAISHPESSRSSVQAQQTPDPA